MRLYRAGSATAKNLSPRSGIDTADLPGRPPGLSFFSTPQAALGAKGAGKVQVLETSDLPADLRLSADDPTEGGTAGHFTLAPVDGSGLVDKARLEEWASRRDGVDVDPLVEAVRSAIVQECKWP